MPLRVASTEGLGGTVHLGTNGYLTRGQGICTQAGLVHESFDHLWRSKLGRGQGFSETKAGFAEFHAAKQYRADPELLSDQGVQPHAAGDEVSTSDRQVSRTTMLGGEAFNFLCFNQRDVLTGLLVPIKVPISFGSHTGNNTNG